MEIGFNREQVAHDRALLGRELASELGGTHNGPALFGGHVAEIADGFVDHALTLLWEVAQLAGRAADRLTHLRAQALHVFHAHERALALLRRHCVETVKGVDSLLLLLRGEAVEAGFLAESIFLLSGRLILMLTQPCRQVLTAGARLVLVLLIADSAIVGAGVSRSRAQPRSGLGSLPGLAFPIERGGFLGGPILRRPVFRS